MRLDRFLTVALSVLALAAGPLQAATLRWAAQNDVISLDPHSQNHATTNGIMQHVYEGLVRYDRNFKVEPSLATSWQYVAPTQGRFNLRKNIKVHDASPFTARDVVFSYSRSTPRQG